MAGRPSTSRRPSAAAVDSRRPSTSGGGAPRPRQRPGGPDRLYSQQNRFFGESRVTPRHTPRGTPSASRRNSQGEAPKVRI